MKSYFAYVRVSTGRQDDGTSPEEQRAAIQAYADRNSLEISEWFKETKTAAKRGRSVFNRMLAGLEQKRAEGVIVHKIDRSVRNLTDWARIGELLDSGFEVYFVHDNLDLSTRGGRLAADVQAVVASDFIRNLKEETRKGRYGRLKQGFYPFPAPRGYLDRGTANVKEIDPVVGPLVRQAFELYGTGNYSLRKLLGEMERRGLCRRTGTPLTTDALSAILHNPFYIGLMRLKATGEVFAGSHEPIVSKALFDRVQRILSGRLYPRTQIHQFLFRRLIKCERCGRSLTGERQKGRVYYRCHSHTCRGVSIVEDRFDELVRRELSHLEVNHGDIGDFREVIQEGIALEDERSGARAQQTERDLGLIDQRIERLTDAVLDGTIDKATYEERKGVLLERKIELQERMSAPGSTSWRYMGERFELGFAALQGYEMGNAEEKRDILKCVGSNLVARQKEPVFPMFFPFDDIRNWSVSNYGLACRGAARTSRRKSIREFLQTLAGTKRGPGQG